MSTQTQKCVACANPASVGSHYCARCERASAAWADAFAAQQASTIVAGPTPVRLTEYPEFDHIQVVNDTVLPAVAAQAPMMLSPQPGVPVATGYPVVADYPGAGYPGAVLAPAYPLPGTKSKVVAGVLGILLGSLGVHNFYLGRTKRGLVQLLVTVFGSVLTFGIAGWAMGTWAFIEGILILVGKPDSKFYYDGYGRPLRQ